jgi:hypothetical protein
MKYLKTYKLYELKSDTYLSAADKLEDLHPARAKNLRQYVDDQQKVDIDYIDPRPFHINNDIYYITNITKQEYEAGGGLEEGELAMRIDITLKSTTTSDEWVEIVIFNNENFIKDDIKLDGSPINRVKIKYKEYVGTEWEEERERTLSRRFFFETRKEARAFLSIIENELGIKMLIKANQIYKSV